MKIELRFCCSTERLRRFVFTYELGLLVFIENCLSAKQPRKSGSDRIGVKRARLQALSRWERAFLRDERPYPNGGCMWVKNRIIVLLFD